MTGLRDVYFLGVMRTADADYTPIKLLPPHGYREVAHACPRARATFAAARDFERHRFRPGEERPQEAAIRPAQLYRRSLSARRRTRQ